MTARSAGPAAMVCADCAADYEHCHGAVIVHADGRTECSDDVECDARLDRHWMTESCARLRPACDCGDATLVTGRVRHGGTPPEEHRYPLLPDDARRWTPRS